MAQKWNLGDIVPPERGKRSERPVREPLDAPRRRVDMGRPTQHPRLPERHDPRDLGRRPLHRVADAPEAYDSVTEEEQMDDDIKEIKIEVGRSHRIKTYLFLTVVAVMSVAAGITATVAMAGAEVTVKPKWKDVTVSAVIEAKRNPSASDIGYELLTLSEEGERTVSATGQEKVTEKATGEITIYNEHSTAKQRLVKNTRFESPDGKIYRITDSVDVPGLTKDAAGKVTPGSIVAKVIADVPGEAHNIGPSKFTIPGLKGSEQYAKVYGESKAPMAGGFEGMKFIIDEGELSKARQELHLELRERLLARLKNERPSGFVFYDGSVTFTYDSMQPTDAGNQSVVLKEQAKLVAPLFKTDSFSRYIADKTIAGYEGEPMRIEDPTKLSFSYPASSTDITNIDTLKFRLDGSVRMIWQYDLEQLRSDLRGVAETALPSILSGYPAIDRSRVVIRPFWRDSFPSDIEKIRIIEVMELPE